MAKGKKSFILYSDQRELFEHLPDELAGKLIKHIYKYVNDENPTADDPIVEVAFISIKNQLKRDLKSWELAQKQRSEAGKKSAEKRKRKSTTVNDRSNRSTKSTVNVNDNVNDNVNEIKKENNNFNFFESLLEVGVEKQVAKDYMEVRKKKKGVNTITAFNGLLNEIGKSNMKPNECIRICVERNWLGFKNDWLNEDNNKKSEPRYAPEGQDIPL